LVKFFAFVRFDFPVLSLIIE